MIWLVRGPQQSRDRSGLRTRDTNGPAAKLITTDHIILGAPCIVRPCALFMDNCAVRLPRQTRLSLPSLRKEIFGFQDTANQAGRGAFEQRMGMAGLQQQGDKIQDQRLPGAIGRERPLRIRRESAAILPIPLGREPDADHFFPMAWVRGLGSKANGCRRERITIRL